MPTRRYGDRRAGSRIRLAIPQHRGDPAASEKKSIPMQRTSCVLAAALAMAASAPAAAQSEYEGYLCCNMRTDGEWISDSNYAENGKRVVPVGTPAKITGYGRYRVKVLLDGKKQEIGNDYSRDLDDEAFARRYIVTEDPKARIAGFPEKTQKAIASQRIHKGMTREQVLMSLGYPISSENPNLDAEMWRYWLSSFAEFQVMFDGAGRVSDITTDPQTRNRVWVE
jgi:hypothetical protein